MIVVMLEGGSHITTTKVQSEAISVIKATTGKHVHCYFHKDTDGRPFHPDNAINIGFLDGKCVGMRGLGPRSPIIKDQMWMWTLHGIAASLASNEVNWKAHPDVITQPGADDFMAVFTVASWLGLCE